MSWELGEFIISCLFSPPPPPPLRMPSERELERDEECVLAWIKHLCLIG